MTSSSSVYNLITTFQTAAMADNYGPNTRNPCHNDNMMSLLKVNGRRSRRVLLRPVFDRIPTGKSGGFESLAVLSLLVMLLLLAANIMLAHQLPNDYGDNFIRSLSRGEINDALMRREQDTNSSERKAIPVQRKYRQKQKRSMIKRNATVTKDRWNREGRSGGHAHRHKLRQNHLNRRGHNTSGVSACLLVNDENLRLPEWIAYHYTVLPLRHLIVAVDPASFTSPRSILELWNDTALGMTVEIWNDEDFLEEEDSGPLDDDQYTEHDRTQHHRYRQWRFVTSCMGVHKLHGRTWVLLTDVDEYILFNKIHDDEPDPPIKEAPPGVATISDWTWYSNGWVGGSVDDKELASLEEISDDDEPSSLDEITDDNETLSSNEIADEEDNEDLSSRDDTTSDEESSNSTIDIGDSFYIRPYGWKNNLIGHDSMLLGNIAVPDCFVFRPKNIQPGNIVHDVKGNEYYLRDDIAYRDVRALKEPPPGAIVMKLYEKALAGLDGAVYGMDGVEDGQDYTILDKDFDEERSTIHGGHFVYTHSGKRIFLEYQQKFWPKPIAAGPAMKARAELPTVGDGATIQDILDNSGNTDVGVLGPCLSLPRLFYGSNESGAFYDTDEEDMIPHPFHKNDFATLRYGYHTDYELDDVNKVSTSFRMSWGDW